MVVLVVVEGGVVVVVVVVDAEGTAVDGAGACVPCCGRVVVGLVLPGVVELVGGHTGSVVDAGVGSGTVDEPGDDDGTDVGAASQVSPTAGSATGVPSGGGGADSICCSPTTSSDVRTRASLAASSSSWAWISSSDSAGSRSAFNALRISWISFRPSRVKRTSSSTP